MLRYIKRLEARDLSLTRAMIPLGSCTMKLNATAEMMPVTLAASSTGSIRSRRATRPQGYQQLFRQLEYRLAEITGFAARVAAAERRLAGRVRRPAGDPRLPPRRAATAHRDVCLIPQSAHGTNPASAVMAGMQVVVGEDATRSGNIDLATCGRRPTQHRDTLAALMVTYPSTHGVFEEAIREICRDRPRARRPGLHGRREHERAGRPLPPGRHRRRRLPPQPAQDVLHPARRRRARAWARSAWPSTSRRSCPGHPVVRPGPARRRAAPCRPRRGAARHPADLVGLHRADGRRRADRGDQGRDPQRELHRAAARAALSRCSTPGSNGLVAHECILDTAAVQGDARASRSRTSPSGSWTTASTRRRLVPGRRAR